MWNRRKKIIYTVVQQGGFLSETVAVDIAWNDIESLGSKKPLGLLSPNFNPPLPSAPLNHFFRCLHLSFLHNLLNTSKDRGLTTSLGSLRCISSRHLGVEVRPENKDFICLFILIGWSVTDSHHSQAHPWFLTHQQTLCLSYHMNLLPLPPLRGHRDLRPKDLARKSYLKRWHALTYL